MDAKSQELFNLIVSMDQETLTNEQKGFLMARRSYMNDEQRKRYADMIKLHEAGKLILEDESDESDEDEEEEAPKAKAKGKGKK